MGFSNYLPSSAVSQAGVCTSTTRPASPYTGQIIYETDTGYLRVWDGTAWDYLSQSQDTVTNIRASDIGGTWTSYTPTLKQGSTTVTNTVNYCKYIQINKIVIVQMSLNITGSGSAGNPFTCSYPSGLGPANNSGYRPLGTLTYNDSGNVFYVGTAIVYDATTFGAIVSGNNNFFGATPSFSAANLDKWEAQLMYEVA